MRLHICIAALLACFFAAPAPADQSRAETPPVIEGGVELTSQTVRLDQTAYLDRLHGMWLGQCLGNWTGLLTEGERTGKDEDGDGRPDRPFFTDEDWGTEQGRDGDAIDFRFLDPWPADDDTDIEYVYLHLMHQNKDPLLSAPEIASGWNTHIKDYIWGSNKAAAGLMERGVMPPATSLPTANYGYLFIDAQLTTEIFGALAPALPGEALRLAHLPIRTVAGNHAAHAAQFHVLLYSLAATIDPEKPLREELLRIVREARASLPDRSKAADVIDLTVQSYLSNRDTMAWESTRDELYERFQKNDRANGYYYLNWIESSVNLGTGVMALLYGEGDLRRTIQIGTLSGWDSDNGTATMAGLIGLIKGHEEIVEELEREDISDLYNAARTREKLPDYIEVSDEATDALSSMSWRMLPLVQQVILEGGGRIDGETCVYTLPLPSAPVANPLEREWRRSVNAVLRAEGRPPGVRASREARDSGKDQATKNPAVITDGVEMDHSGKDISELPRYYSSWGFGGQREVFEITYSEPVRPEAIRFIEGDHFPDSGGWYESLEWHVREHGEWIQLGTVKETRLDSEIPYQVLDFLLPEGMAIDGVRVYTQPGGPDSFGTISEIDLILPEG